jgi:hypothetical protein
MSQDKDYFGGRNVEETAIDKGERGRLRKIVGACVAGALVAVFALLWVKDAKAAEMFRGMGGDGKPAILKILNEPCTNEKVVGHLQSRLLDFRLFKRAILTYGDRDWASCWAEVNGVVLSVDEEDAPFQAVPRVLFKEEGI